MFGVMGWVQAGGGIMGGRKGRDCCSIEVLLFSVLYYLYIFYYDLGHLLIRIPVKGMSSMLSAVLPVI